MSTPTSSRPIWLLVTTVAVVVVVVTYVADVLAGIDGSARSSLRVAVVLAAALAAAAVYQRWSVVPTRTPAHHAMAASGLLGGALVASSVFTDGSGVFAGDATGALGAAALLVALVAARATLTVSKEPR